MRKTVYRYFLQSCLAITCQAEPAVVTKDGQTRTLSREEAAKAQPSEPRGVLTTPDSDPRPSFIGHVVFSKIGVVRSKATAGGIRRGDEIDVATGAGGHAIHLGPYGFLPIDP